MLTMKNRKGQLGCGQEMEDGDLWEAESCRSQSMHSAEQIHARFHPLSDGYDDILMGDTEDQAHFGASNELERESELCDWSLKREELLYKWGIKCLLVAEKKKNSSIVDGSRDVQDIAVALKERSRTRRRHAKAQRVANKRRSAVDRSIAQPNCKRAKESPESEHIEDHQESDGQHHQYHYHAHHLKEHEQLHAVRKRIKLKVRDVYSEESSSCADDEQETFISSLKELTKALLTRTQLESFLDKPIFEQTVIGCFVRISIGSIACNQPAVYRLSRIVAVKQSDHEYLLGNHRTRRVLQLQLGVQLRDFQMDAVSNLPVIKNEFTFWLDACQRDAQPLPSVSSIDKKQKDIEMATNYAFMESDSELMVQSDRKPVSGAYRKACLITEWGMAVDCNEVENQIEQSEEQSEISASARILSMESATKSTHQYMPFRFKKIADLNRLEGHQWDHALAQNSSRTSVEPVALPVHMEEPVLHQLEVSEESNLDMLDLYELYNFEVNLDLSNLRQFSEIFNEIEGTPPDANAQ